MASCLALVLALSIAGLEPARAERDVRKLKHWDIHRSDWPEKPTAALVSQLDPLPELFKHYRNRRSSVEIRYPGGRQGRQWATEVRGWLVALGIPTNDIVLSVGMDSPEQLRLALIPRLRD